MQSFIKKGLCFHCILFLLVLLDQLHTYGLPGDFRFGWQFLVSSLLHHREFKLDVVMMLLSFERKSEGQLRSRISHYHS